VTRRTATALPGAARALAWMALLALPSGLAGQDLTVTSNLPSEEFAERDHPVELRFNRTLDPAVERVAVFFGATDVTDLFRREQDALRYDTTTAALPSGERELVVYRVGADGTWSEIVRMPLRVVGPLGFATARWDPGVAIGLQGNLTEDHKPPDNAPPRDNYQDLTGELTVTSEHVRAGMRIVGQAKVVGVSHRPQALRFATLGRDAPAIDLSDYVLTWNQGDASFSLGHVGFGEQRHLIQGFNSRGTLFAYRPSERFGVSLAAVNGSSIVGWRNAVGLDEPDHRVLSATAGVEAFRRPGALRMELTWLGASVLPQAGFNQGVVNDAEESRGVGLRILTGTAGRRLQLETGYARSRYENPFDPTLAQGDDLVPVEQETKDARYVQASAELLRDRKLFGTRTMTVGLTFRHERVDPLYQSIGAYVRPDMLQNQLDLSGTVAGVQLQASQARSEDNLDDLPNIMKTKDKRGSASVTMPLATVLGVEGPRAVWLPHLRYGVDRTHQFGTGIPPNSGFQESHIPDQVSFVHNASADWQWRRVGFGWRFNRSKQDNRQTGRENADFRNRSHGFALGLTPHERLRLDFDLSLERREALERDEVDKTRRWGVRGNWSAFDRSTLSVSWAATHLDGRNGILERDDTTLDAQFSSFVPYLGRLGGQWFLRLSRTSNDSADTQLDTSEDRSNWALDSGLNFNFFQ
jgi:hypothetical protein